MKAAAEVKEEITDSTALRNALEGIADKAGNGLSGQEMRNACAAVLKNTLKSGQRACEKRLLQEGAGISCARQLCHLVDTLVTTLHDFATGRIYPPRTSSGEAEEERIALIAVGGYGRGTLAPGSDIDLMFLLPWKRSAKSEQVMEFILYMLWDAGLKVGHSTRHVDEAIRIALEDMTVRTALLEARFLAGNRALSDTLAQRFATDVIPGSADAFIRAKLTERDQRHKKAGETRYLVEPNVKESKGGQRDLQMLLWITKYFYRIRSPENLVETGVLSRREARIFRKAENFLWAVRCHMHFFAGRAQERLSFEIQREIAHRLGYTAHPGLKDVERFMKHYFLTARQVGNLTRIISAALEEAHAMAVPGLNRVFRTFSRRSGRIRGAKGFVVDNHRINISTDRVFEDDPVNLIRIFHLADRHGLEFHPHAMRQMARSLRLIDAHLRENRTANALFLDILTSPRHPAMILRRMNESGVLGKFIPDFGRIVAMMQFNMYHHYTVDEHLLRCIGHLAAIENGETGRQHPLAHSLIPALRTGRRVLHVAALLHDIARGRPENHCIAGEKIARRLCPRLGLTSSETATVAWLVREHLTMSRVAQSRDLNDPRTITDFAATVQTVERLRLLLILTVCDIKGVGPGVWNGWKGQLLRTLYLETEAVLTGSLSQEPDLARLKAARRKLAGALESWDASARRQYLDLLPPGYWLAVSAEEQLRHAHFIAGADREKKSPAIMVRLMAFEAVTQITVFAPDHPRLLSIITGACAAAGANIVDAQIFTTTDGRALDTILISRAFSLDEDEARRARRVGRLIENILSGKTPLPEIVPVSRTKQKRTAKAFERAPQVEINNTLSDTFSIIEVKGLDRPGLLSGLTAVISDLSLNIASAHINTFGEKVIDSFYVSDLRGRKITGPQRQRSIRNRLLSVFETLSPEHGRQPPPEKPAEKTI